MLLIFKCFSLQHCAGINCLAVLKSSVADGCDYLFTGSRDSTLKRWSLAEDGAACSSTFESHVDWVLPLLALGSIYNCGISLMNHQTIIFQIPGIVSISKAEMSYGIANSV